MTAKNKDDFLFQLHTELHRIGVDDNEDIFADFEEHFRESGEQGISEEETCQKLGDVKEIARSYVDIESTRINSILANAIEDSRPHVSLTKPGRSEPAASMQNQTAAVPQMDTAIIPEPVTPIREYTPEHIHPEQPSVSAQNTATYIHIDAPTPTFSSNTQPEQTQPQQQAVREFTPQHTSAESATVGGTGDSVNTAAPQPEAQFQQPQQNADPHVAEYPGGCTVKVEPSKNSFRWSDLKGRIANPDIGRIILWLCLDIFVFSWAIPALGGVIFGGYWGIVVGVGAAGVAAFVAANSVFHLLSSIFLGVGLLSLAIILGGLGVKIVIGYVKIIRNIIVEHVKAIYGI